MSLSPLPENKSDLCSWKKQYSPLASQELFVLLPTETIQESIDDILSAGNK